MPLKIPFFRLGEWVHPLYGKLKITQQTFDQLLANFKGNVLGRPPFIRIGHDKSSNQTFGYAPAEGWVTGLKQEGNVLYAEVEPTTPQAEENIRTKRYRFSSAEYTPDGVDRETGKKVGALLSAIALTNEPFLTKLPEATLLADTPDMFYLDFSDAKEEPTMPNNDPETKTVLQELSEGIKRLLGMQQAPPVTVTSSVSVDPNVAAQITSMQEQLQKFSGVETQLQTLAEENKALKAQVGVETGARRLAEVEKTAADMVAQGIPPVQVDAWKVLALSEAGQVTLKLSDAEGKTKDVSQADAMRDMLLALPTEHRIKLGQQGSQTAPVGDEQLKLACDEDIKALGGTIGQDGKYNI